MLNLLTAAGQRGVNDRDFQSFVRALERRASVDRDVRKATVADIAGLGIKVEVRD